MAKVTLSKIEKIYPGDGKNPDFLAVKEIDLEIRDREFMVLVGPSGCAKSTTLRMIAGLEEITSGEISIGDRVVNDVAPKDRNIAMVFQNYALYPHMTLYDNMAFGLKLQKKPKAEIKKRVEEAAKILGLEGILQRKPKALSGGQRQRVALGRAIVRQPEVFLFDEPLSNLDAKMRVQMRTEISKLHARLDATMIYVTHDQTEAMTMGDRITVMKFGEIMQVAEPLELYNNPVNMFVAGFIGSPPMNFLHGKIEAEGEGLAFIDDGTDAKIVLNKRLAERAKDYKGKKIVLGIRPEDITDKKIFKGDIPANTTLSATVEVSETMGAETFLYLNVGKDPIIARVDPGERYKMNSKIDIVLDLEKAHVFDPESEIALV